MTIRSTTHTARKSYTCEGCWKPIPAGTKYVREVYRYDDHYIFSEAVHVHCKRAEVLVGAEGWYNALSGEKIRAVGFFADQKDALQEADQDLFIAIFGAG